MKIVLIGFMCSGKSKVGKALSQKIGWPHFDTDHLIEETEKATIAEIIANQGETAFRKIEKKVVQSLSEKDQCIISTGGGVPLDPDNMKSLSANATSVWLKVSPKTVLKRAGDIKTRPLIDPSDPLGSISNLIEKRKSFYAKANVSVDTDNKTTSRVADAILKKIPKPKK